MSIQVTRSSMPEFEEYVNEIRELWGSRWLTNAGVKHQQLQSELEAYLRCGTVTLFANGHLALENLLAACRFPRGCEIITTPFTFASTTNAIIRNGLVPVFCDVEPETYTLDASKLEALITDRTAAIVPVHVYGNLCDTDAIGRIAAAHGLRVFYDAAHAFGVTRSGVSAACFGDASMFSFHATKVFHSVEGGAVCCRDKALAEKLCALRNFGLQDAESCPDAGGNAKMSEFHAAMGLCNLRHLDEAIALRREAALRYRRNLSGVPGLRLCPEQPGVRSNYAYFPVVFDAFPYTRDEICDRLATRGVMARKYFYPLTSSFACCRDFPTAGVQHTPTAAQIARRVLTLPLFAGLTAEQVDEICAIILD